jgi:hypothetical protein
MVYSDDMRPWIEAAADAFAQRCPDIEVVLVATPDLKAADAIFERELTPVVWAPTDEMSLRYLSYRWDQRGGPPAFDPAASTSLVESPLVLLIWQDRLRLLSALLREERSDEGLWVRGPCARIPRKPSITGPIEAMVPGTWQDWYARVTPSVVAPPADRRKPRTAVVAPPIHPLGDEPLPTLDQAAAWGRVKIGHAKPTQDSGGNAALYLMAYDYLLPPSDLQSLVLKTADESRGAGGAPPARDDHSALAFEKAFTANKASLGRWLQRCEAGLDAPTVTTPDLTKAMFDVGPSLYDAVVTYEHLALPYLDRVDTHPDALRKLMVVYPEPTLLARHPAVVFDASAAQQAAARRWLRFLLGKDMQEKAVEAGFRPVTPEVTIAGYNVEGNQFMRLRRYGIVLQPHLKEAPRPDGSHVQELISLWGEVTGRN